MNRRAKSFREQYEVLPRRIKDAAVRTYKQFESDPSHPSLNWHRLKDNAKGSHRNGSMVVYVNMQYRAIYYQEGDRNIWYWIGTHNEYNTFVGLK